MLCLCIPYYYHCFTKMCQLGLERWGPIQYISATGSYCEGTDMSDELQNVAYVFSCISRSYCTYEIYQSG